MHAVQQCYARRASVLFDALERSNLSANLVYHPYMFASYTRPRWLPVPLDLEHVGAVLTVWRLSAWFGFMVIRRGVRSVLIAAFSFAESWAVYTLRRNSTGPCGGLNARQACAAAPAYLQTPLPFKFHCVAGVPSLEASIVTPSFASRICELVLQHLD